MKSNSILPLFARDPLKNYPLHIACAENDLDKVMELLNSRDTTQESNNNNCDNNCNNDNGSNNQNKPRKIFSNINERGLFDATPLLTASRSGSLQVVKSLVAHGADLNLPTVSGKMRHQKNDSQNLKE